MSHRGAGQPAPSAAPQPSSQTLPARTRTSGHGHLWRLPDGTGLHAPYATLVRSEDGTAVCCHMCGRWFRHLGAHVRVHELSAADYRDKLGLLKTAPLAAADVCATIADRQRAAYRADPAMRSRFAEGQQMARSGQLAWVARRSEDSPQRAADRRTRLEAGRATSEARRAEQLARRLAHRCPHRRDHDCGRPPLACSHRGD